MESTYPEHLINSLKAKIIKLEAEVKQLQTNLYDASWREENARRDAWINRRDEW